MRRLAKNVLSLGFMMSLSLPLWAQEDNAALEVPGEASAETPAAPEEDLGAVLGRWEKQNTKIRFASPRKWLFLQEQGGSYGAPSPLAVDKLGFDGYGWLQLAEAEAIRLFVQLNPSQRSDTVKPEDLPARLKRYATLTRSDGIVLRTASSPATWAIYTSTKDLAAPQVTFDKGPDTLRQDMAARWLVQKLGYDATVVGAVDDYLVLAKIKPVRRGAQGLILRKSTSALVSDSDKDVGALLRVVHESDDYLLAKVLLAKSGRPKVPAGSKVLFDEP